MSLLTCISQSTAGPLHHFELICENQLDENTNQSSYFHLISQFYCQDKCPVVKVATWQLLSDLHHNFQPSLCLASNGLFIAATCQIFTQFIQAIRHLIPFINVWKTAYTITQQSCVTLVKHKFIHTLFYDFTKYSWPMKHVKRPHSPPVWLRYTTEV